jgi:outer membrane receptor protein involved in Fe transport
MLIRIYCRWYSLAAIALLAAPPAGVLAQATGTGPIDEIVVTAQRRQQSPLQVAGNIAQLDEATMEEVQHQHIHELLNRVAGAWVMRGSGQEHLTAIRSPVLSGAGSCGGFVFLEDGIPIRPSGFCNVNQLMEINTEQARSIEVIRGPGNALYGSNALHGVINVLMPEPLGGNSPHLALETGANDFLRIRAALPFNHDARWYASMVYADDGGFREHSGYRQAKLHLKGSGSALGGDFRVGFTATDLDQDTAGFIIGQDAYKDPALNRANLDPDAFRDVQSQRLYAIWSRSFGHFDLDVRPYVRHSEMRFLHHFMPGTPEEDNGQVSAGALLAASFSGPRADTVLGVDLEWSDIYLQETQAGPAQGPPRVVATRPQGKHYDYTVASASVAPYLQTEYALGQRLFLGAGLRAEYIHYDYDNRMLAGNTRDDGSPCGFGGCLQSRPADRSDNFTNLAPKLALRYLISADTMAYASLARGFRAPQMTELYRLQNGQQVSDLDSEKLDSLEAGLRLFREAWSLDLAAYAMRKRDSVFRDAEGFNVSGARTRHHGIEAALDWQFSEAWALDIDATWARHRYDFDTPPGQGERFVSGNDADSAPRWLGSLDVRYEPGGRLRLGLQWLYLGKYFLDAENRFRYPGHRLVNLRAAWRVNPEFHLALRLNNATDEAVADRADFGFGDYRYFPGRGRELFAEIRYTPSGPGS